MSSTSRSGLRDLRDPAKMGEEMEAIRQGRLANGMAPLTASARADLLESLAIPDFRHDDSVIRETVEAYQEELQIRAAAGDKYALSMLNGEAFNEGEVTEYAKHTNGSTKH